METETTLRNNPSAKERQLQDVYDGRIHQRHQLRKAIRIPQRMLDWFGPFTIPLVFVVISLLVFQFSRFILLMWNVPFESMTFKTLLLMEYTGTKHDLIAALALASPQALFVSILPLRVRRSRPGRWSFMAMWLMGLLFLPFYCVAEWLFFADFHSRFNYITFEYIVYPTEFCCNIWESYPIVSLTSSVAVIGVGLLLALKKTLLKSLAREHSSWRWRLLGIYLAAGAVLFGSSHQDDVNISDHRVINECSGNGLYSFAYYAWSCRFDYEALYLTIDEPELTERLRESIVLPTDTLHTGSSNPVDRTVRTGKPQSNYHVVLILEESLGADFVGALGRKDSLTPNLDELAKEGILFENFYATGNRTARALEAVLTSMPPLPTESILKRDHSDRVFTLAHVFEQRGYQRLFMTGGRGIFDGVKSFMKANGFDQFLEQSDYESPCFVNAWGVSDEDLFKRALQEFDRMHESGQPFFSVVLTVSNHRPYTFPPNRIIPQDFDRGDAVRYADWALGEFFRNARQRPFFNKTIFVVMGDHGARVYGAPLFPLRSYRVPVVILHPNHPKTPRRNNTLGCSMDIAPTILGLLGGEYRSVFYGHDLLDGKANTPRLALMQHNHNLAMLTPDNHVVMIGANRTHWSYNMDPIKYDLRNADMPGDTQLGKTIALFQSAHRLYYSDRWFPDVPERVTK